MCAPGEAAQRENVTVDVYRELGTVFTNNNKRITVAFRHKVTDERTSTTVRLLYFLHRDSPRVASIDLSKEQARSTTEAFTRAQAGAADLQRQLSLFETRRG